jgi:glycosyltransferase involved in cell wall biosynthesis
MTQARGVAALGDSENIGTWSGIPYHLLHAGLQVGFLARGLDLRIPNFKTSRGIWQIQRVLCAERPRGFQYSSSFVDSLGGRALEECSRKELTEIISHYQVLPANDLVGKSIATSYYIDSTLHDLFETSGMLSWLNKETVREVINREIDGYRAAKRIVTMSSWARTTLKGSYGIAEDRIFTVLPGANLPEEEVKVKLGDVDSFVVPDEFTRDRKLRIGFTGKDWRRKGLRRLVSAVEILNRMGIPSEVVVIGHIPRQYQHHPNVRVLGFIDKSTEMSRFINIVAGCDLGCAPSHEEPLGIAPLEYLRLGVPVLCTAAGGLTDVCRAAGPASVLLDKDANAEQIAFAFEALTDNPDQLRQMRTAAWERKEYFSWSRTVTELQRIWEPGVQTQSEPTYLMTRT